MYISHLNVCSYRCKYVFLYLWQVIGTQECLWDEPLRPVQQNADEINSALFQSIPQITYTLTSDKTHPEHISGYVSTSIWMTIGGKYNFSWQNCNSVSLTWKCIFKMMGGGVGFWPSVGNFCLVRKDICQRDRHMGTASDNGSVSRIQSKKLYVPGFANLALVLAMGTQRWNHALKHGLFKR